jgi:hypothetical protein
MQKPLWGAADDGWPYELFTFAASVATMPTVTHGPLAGPIPEPGLHAHAGGALDLVLAGCSISTLVAYHVRRMLVTRR